MTLSAAGEGLVVSTTTRPEQPRRLERRAFALMADTASNALLGLIFWTLAARLYPASEVGRGTALISAATLLSTLAQLNLGNVYARFLGSAGGARQRQLVVRGLGAVFALGLLLGCGYLLLGPTGVLFHDTLERVLFPFSVAALAVFVLQDMVLVSLQKAMWVPIENISWGVLKLALLVLIAGRSSSDGIGMAWMLPSIAAVGVVTGYLLLRRWTAAPSGGEPFPHRRQLQRAVGAEYASGLISTTVPLALPLLVVHLVGLEANAYFAVPWLFATSLSLLMWNIAAILLVEAAAAPLRRAALLGRALRLSLLVAVSGGVTIWFASPFILHLLGPGYEEHSTWLLRFVGLAAPAVAVVVVWTTASRSRNRMPQVMAVQVVIAALLLALVILLVARVGVVGVGIAYLGANALVAGFLIRPLLRMLGRPTVARAP